MIQISGKPNEICLRPLAAAKTPELAQNAYPFEARVPGWPRLGNE